MRKIFLILSLFIFSCDNEDECSSGVFDECGVCDGPGKVPENEDDCGYVTQCGYVTVSLGANSYCTNSCIDGASCTSSQDCYYNDGFASSGCNASYYCVTTTQDYVCEDVYECNTNTTYVCP